MTEGAPHVHPLSRFLYHIVLFFAYWFGAHRFDMDGDGDFEADDVEKYLADRGWISKNFRQKASAKRSRRRPAPKHARAGVADPSGDGQAGDIFESNVDGRAQEDEVLDNLFVKQTLPWFMTLQCLLCLIFWSIFAIQGAIETGENLLQLKAGVDSVPLWEGMTELRLTDDCEDLRFQAWRWLTYQWTHVGAMHVLMNVFLCVILGIPLEGFHGGVRMLVMFNVGVVGGAFCYFVNDAHTVVVGCSGGCYALIGMHVADLIMNWSAKKYRKPTLVFLAVLIGADVFSYAVSLPANKVSHSAHVGGAIAGLIIGVMIGVNKKVESGERALQAVFLFVGLVLAGFCLVWLLLHTVPINIWEASRGELEHCWVRQIFNASLDSTGWLCVRCRDQQCIQAWEYMQAKPVSVPSCNKVGWHYGFMP